MKGAKDILYGIQLLAGIIMAALVLNRCFGATAAGIYAAVSFTGYVCTIYELCHAPMIEEEPSTDNQ